MTNYSLEKIDFNKYKGEIESVLKLIAPSFVVWLVEFILSILSNYIPNEILSNFKPLIIFSFEKILGLYIKKLLKSDLNSLAKNIYITFLVLMGLIC